jgi:cell division protease FtsH
VFLGEDLVHTRDYSDHTSQVIDDEVERILREQEARAIEVLTLHRRGLESRYPRHCSNTRPSTATPPPN